MHRIQGVGIQHCGARLLLINYSGMSHRRQWYLFTHDSRVPSTHKATPYRPTGPNTQQDQNFSEIPLREPQNLTTMILRLQYNKANILSSSAIISFRNRALLYWVG